MERKGREKWTRMMENICWFQLKLNSRWANLTGILLNKTGWEIK